MTEAEKVQLRAAIAALQKMLEVPADRLGLLAPMYAYPAGDGLLAWNALIAVAARIHITAVANPSSGPGAVVDPNYTAVINRAVAAGIRVVGYVHTSEGTRAPADVIAEIRRWWALYPSTSGCFLDEYPTLTGRELVMASYCDEIRRVFPGRLVLGNPGTWCARSYYDTGKPDLLVLRENAGTSVTLPSWAVAEPDARFAVISHHVSEATMKAVVANARTNGYGHLWCTQDGPDGNAYDSVPVYFSQMVDAIAAA